MASDNLYQGLIHKYRSRLPVSAQTPVISLSEGNTPLIKLCNLVDELAIPLDIYVKYEGLNPTGSFKDRGMTLAVSKAVEEGSRAVMCASTGNTSAAAAAYAARAGVQCFVIVPEGNIALGKLAQAMMHGAKVLQIQGNFDQGLELVKQVAEQLPITIVNSINPYRLQGQKTAAFEVVEQLGKAPDYHCLPVGNAGNITAYWMGYCEYFAEKTIATKPKMLGFQAAGAAPIVNDAIVKDPETIATAIRIGNPASWQQAVAAQQQSEGWFATVTDQEILAAQQLLASKEGIFCEPASAASLAGLLNAIKEQKIEADSTIVCTLTGHGLKDPQIAIEQNQDALIKVSAQLADVERVISEYMNDIPQ